MQSIAYIDQAIKALDKEVESLIMDMSLSLSEKDDKMLPLSQQKRILLQCREDLQYIIDNPPSLGVCKPGQIRKEQESGS